MDEPTGEARKRKNSTDDALTPQKKKLRKATKSDDMPISVALTEDEVFDIENDRTLDQRKSWLKSQNVKELGRMCTDKQLKKGGRKEELVERLLTLLTTKTAPLDNLEGQTEPRREHSDRFGGFTPANRAVSRVSNEAVTPIESPLQAPKFVSRIESPIVAPQPCETLASSRQKHSSHTEDLHERPRRALHAPPEIGKIRRHYQGLSHTITELLQEFIHFDAARFEKDLEALSFEQAKRCYCLLAHRVQALAHNSEPCLELKDKKALADTESKETAFMAMDALEQNFHMIASLEWHNQEIHGQRKIMTEQSAHIQQLQRERERDAEFFTKRIEDLSRRIAGGTAQSLPTVVLKTQATSLNDARFEGQQADVEMVEANLNHEDASEPALDMSASQDTVPQGEELTDAAPTPQSSTPESHLPGLSVVVPDSQDDTAVLNESQRSEQAAPPTPVINEPPLKPPPSPVRLSESPIIPTNTDDVHPSSLVDSPATAALLRPAVPPLAPTSTPALSDRSQDEHPAREMATLLSYDDEEKSEPKMLLVDNANISVALNDADDNAGEVSQDDVAGKGRTDDEDGDISEAL